MRMRFLLNSPIRAATFVSMSTQRTAGGVAQDTAHRKQPIRAARRTVAVHTTPAFSAVDRHAGSPQSGIHFT